MTELEQLRKEVNELRERVAKLEHPTGPTPYFYPWERLLEPQPQDDTRKYDRVKA